MIANSRLEYEYMKILCVTVAWTRVGSGADQRAANQRTDSGFTCGSNEVAYLRRQRVLPIQLLAIVGDLLDAGHEVYWPEESLNAGNIDRLIKEAQGFSPDVVFFACGDQQSQSLMASVAVKTHSILGNEFLNDPTMRPAHEWCSALTEQNASVHSLLQRLSAAHDKARGNDAYHFTGHTTGQCDGAD